jgi:four helix bundle protein
MARSDFENLRVYQVAERLADAVWDAAQTWTPFARDTVGKQIARAADSIGANIAEGAGRGSFVDNKRFVRIARGSLNETKHFLRRAYRRRLLTPEQVAQLQPLAENLAPQLNAYLQSIGPGEGTPARRNRAPSPGPQLRITDY